MFGEVTIQDWLGLIGPNDADLVIQDSDLWVDTDAYDSVRLRTEILQITDTELKIETAVSLEGPWTTLLTYSTATEYSAEIECDPNATYQLERYLRWKVDPTAATWDICFMIAAMFQKLDGSSSAGAREHRPRPRPRPTTLTPPAPRPRPGPTSPPTRRR